MQQKYINNNLVCEVSTPVKVEERNGEVFFKGQYHMNSEKGIREKEMVLLLLPDRGNEKEVWPMTVSAKPRGVCRRNCRACSQETKVSALAP